MSIPKLAGIHHLKIPVNDLESRATWFNQVFGAERISKFDHKDDGKLFAVILKFPGVDNLIELRHAPKAAAAVAGYDPITFAVDDEAALQAWSKHLDEVGVEHSDIKRGFIGQLMEFKSPDDLEIRFYTKPVGGFEKAEFDSTGVVVHDPSLDSKLMQS